MNEVNKKLELLGSAPVPRALLALGLPTMVGMLINALYNLADAFFVAGVGQEALGAVSVAFPLGQAVVGLGLLFGNGAAPYLSRRLGSGDREGASRAAATALYSSLAVGVLMIAAVLAFLEPLLGMLGATESILPHALAYCRIYVAASLCNVFNVTMNNIVSSEGAAKTTMAVLLTGAALNVVLDPVLIYGVGLGAAGAAAATAISQLASSLIYLGYIRSGRSAFRFRICSGCFSREIYGEILKIGVPTLAFQLLSSLAAALTNSRAEVYGDAAIAAMGAVTKVLSVGSLVVFGFLKGFQSIAGYSCGAKKYGRLREAVRVSVLWSTAFCTVFGLGLAVFSGPVMALFAKGEPALAAIGGEALRACGLSFVLFGFYTVYSFLLLAMGRAGEGLLLGLCRQGICFLPMIWLLPAVWGLPGILYAQPAADVLAAAVAAGMAVRVHRQLGA